jgi:putative membrane protein
MALQEYDMKLKSTQALLLGTAVLLAPIALRAQNDPSGMPGTTPTTGLTPPMAQPNHPSPNSQGTPGVVHPNMPAGDSSMVGGAGSEGQMMKDKLFLRKAAQGSLAEIQLGQLAADKGSSEAVKRFGQKMVNDHGRLIASLQPFADSLGVRAATKPSKMDQMEYEKLSSLQGLEFDKEYLAYMSKDHHQDMRDFRDEADSTSDPALKEAVSNGLAVIARHSYMADKLAAANGVAVTSDNH